MFLGKDERVTPVKNQDTPIAYRISVLAHPLAPSRREGE